MNDFWLVVSDKKKSRELAIKLQKITHNFKENMGRTPIVTNAIGVNLRNIYRNLKKIRASV